jgi:hypothetical protein
VRARPRSRRQSPPPRASEDEPRPGGPRPQKAAPGTSDPATALGLGGTSAAPVGDPWRGRAGWPWSLCLGGPREGTPEPGLPGRGRAVPEAGLPVPLLGRWGRWEEGSRGAGGRTGGSTMASRTSRHVLTPILLAGVDHVSVGPGHWTPTGFPRLSQPGPATPGSLKQRAA